MTEVILQWQLTSTSMRFPRVFKTVTLLFQITQFFIDNANLGDMFEY